MTRIVLDVATRDKLLNLAQPLELCDESGHVLAVLTPCRHREPKVTEEELDRRQQEAESSKTAEMLARLERL